MEMIKKFCDNYRFLSNFYPAPVIYDGVTYPTVEHAFQAAKCLYTKDRLKIKACPTPGAAKKMGRHVAMRPEWNDVRVNVMRSLLEQKFRIPTLRDRLLATGDAFLIEGNRWGDTFWGVDNDAEGTGRNHLGYLLMEIRSGLKDKDPGN